MSSRRRFLSGALAVVGCALSGCAPKGRADGLVAIQWDRELCTQCGMVISDRRFAAQLQGGPGNLHCNFDDIGCAVTWLAAQGWPAGQEPRLWVAAIDGQREPRWLAATAAWYLPGRGSPMGYGFGAVDRPVADGLEFNRMRDRVLEQRKAMA